MGEKEKPDIIQIIREIDRDWHLRPESSNEDDRYLFIKSLGETAIIPLLLDLANNDDIYRTKTTHMCLIEEISKDLGNPIEYRDEDRGHYDAIADACIDWGLKNHYVEYVRREE